LETNIFSIPVVSLKSSENLQNLQIPSNPSGFTIVLNTRFDTKEYQIFLEKVFQAVGLDYNDQITKIVLDESDQFSLSDHSIFANIQKLIFFGVSPISCGINYHLPPYKMVDYDQRKYLFADYLDAIISSPNLKKDFWIALQQLEPKK